MNSVLEVDGLEVGYVGSSGRTTVVRDVSISLRTGRLGVVGESGSGKSTVARALMGLLPRSAQVSAKRLEFQGTDLLRLRRKDWSKVRGRRMAMILQDPRYSLNPVIRIGDQVAEAYRIHFGMSRSDALKKAILSLEEVQIRDPERVARQFPHQLSGGMGQRVMIASMLAAEPSLLIADEPTSALDSTVACQVLELLARLMKQREMGLVLISHNLPMVGAFCDRVLVMKAGAVVDSVAAADLPRSTHPYTAGLMAAIPGLHAPGAMLPVLSTTSNA